MIDGPEDLTPYNVRREAGSLKYTGRAHSAMVLDWLADMLDELHALNDRAAKEKIFIWPSDLDKILKGEKHAKSKTDV